MSTIGITSRLITDYAESEPWKEHHDRAMLCCDIEESLTWGIYLFRGLSALESAMQARVIRRRESIQTTTWTEFERIYRLWVTTSEQVLSVAKELTKEGFTVDGLDEFSQLAEEAQCQIGLWDLEHEIPPIEELLCFVRPENPRPDRYGT